LYQPAALARTAVFRLPVLAAGEKEKTKNDADRPYLKLSALWQAPSILYFSLPLYNLA
jgi:hypothetical protein